MLFLLLTAQLASSTTAVDTLFLALPQPVGGYDTAARSALLKDPTAHVVIDKKNGFLHADRGPVGVVVEAAVFEGKSRRLLAVTVREDCGVQYFHVYDVDAAYEDVTAAVVPVVTLADISEAGDEEVIAIEVALPRHGTTLVVSERSTCMRLPAKDGGPGMQFFTGRIIGTHSIDLAFDGVAGFVKKKTAPH